MATEKQKELKEAVRQVKLKLKLEKVLLRKITTFFNKQSRLLKSHLANDEPFDASQMAPELKKILEKHYKVVSKKFTGPMIDGINKSLLAYDPTITPIRKDNKLLEAAITLFILNSVNDSTAVITHTSNKIVTKGTVKVERDIAAGIVKPDEKNSEILGSFNRKKQGRSRTISITETQNASEGSKHTTSKAMSDGVISSAVLYGGSIGVTVVRMIKEWFTMGDAKVRGWHAMANNQQQLEEDSFIVDNEFLMYPGDSSQGASPRNICNCRCVSLYRTLFV